MDSIKPLRQVQKEHILQVLRSTKGDLDQAARVLGVSQAALRRLLKEHGLTLRGPDGQRVE